MPTDSSEDRIKSLNQAKTPLSSTVPGRGKLGKRGLPKQLLVAPTVMGHGQPGTQRPTQKHKGPPRNPLPSRGQDHSQLRKQGPSEKPLSSTVLDHHGQPRKQGPPKQLKFFSLKLDVPLTESGKEVGRVMCSIDAWWIYDKEPAKDTPDGI
jgi:hypothetical protein